MPIEALILENYGNLSKKVIPSKSSASSNPTKLIVDDRAVENANEIAHTFNNCFVEIGSSIAQSNGHSNEDNFKTFLKQTVSQTIVLDPSQPIEIFNVINSLSLERPDIFYSIVYQPGPMDPCS